MTGLIHALQKVALDIGTQHTLPLSGGLTPLYTELRTDAVVTNTESTRQTGRPCQLQ